MKGVSEVCKPGGLSISSAKPGWTEIYPLVFQHRHPSRRSVFLNGLATHTQILAETELTVFSPHYTKHMFATTRAPMYQKGGGGVFGKPDLTSEDKCLIPPFLTTGEMTKADK